MSNRYNSILKVGVVSHVPYLEKNVDTLSQSRISLERRKANQLRKSCDLHAKIVNETVLSVRTIYDSICALPQDIVEVPISRSYENQMLLGTSRDKFEHQLNLARDEDSSLQRIIAVSPTLTLRDTYWVYGIGAMLREFCDDKQTSLLHRDYFFSAGDLICPTAIVESIPKNGHSFDNGCVLECMKEKNISFLSETKGSILDFTTFYQKSLFDALKEVITSAELFHSNVKI